MRPHWALWVLGLSLVLAHAVCARAEPGDAGKTEVGFFPLLGGGTDLGWGGGAFGSLARYEPGYIPYRYRLEAAAAITFRGDDAGITVPYRDVYLLLTLPDLTPRRVRLEVRASYTRESTLAYYGLGNASPAPDFGSGGRARRQYYQYELEHPTLLVRLRVRLSSRVRMELGDLLTYQHLSIREGSLLAEDMQRPELRRFFGPTQPHLINVFEYTVYYDTRDQETSTHWGMYHQLRLRLSPGGVMPMPYRYGQVNLTLRVYKSYRIWTFAARLVLDSMFGDPPFYELPRYEDTFALGGVNGVRGVPAQRYYGKQKIFGNLEARVQLSAFRLFDLACKLYGVLFFDAGRLWSDFPPDPALDGRGLGLRWGAGAGLRLQQGRSFVVRADLAWSPDALPIGAYVIAGQAF